LQVSLAYDPCLEELRRSKVAAKVKAENDRRAAFIEKSKAVEAAAAAGATQGASKSMMG